MPVRIRLAQRGKKKNRTFRVIVADSRSPRDGKFIEDIGYYDPHHNPSISGAWAQWRSKKGEVVSIPQAPDEKIKSSSKANNKQQEENLEEEVSNDSEKEASSKEEE